METKSLIQLESSAYVSESVFNEDASEVGLLISSIFPVDDESSDTNLGFLTKIKTNQQSVQMSSLTKLSNVQIYGDKSFVNFKLAWLDDELIWLYFPKAAWK